MALDFLGRLGGSSLGYRAGGDVHGSKAGAGIAEVGMAGVPEDLYRPGADCLSSCRTCMLLARRNDAPWSPPSTNIRTGGFQKSQHGLDGCLALDTHQWPSRQKTPSRASRRGNLGLRSARVTSSRPRAATSALGDIDHGYGDFLARASTRQRLHGRVRVERRARRVTCATPSRLAAQEDGWRTHGLPPQSGAETTDTHGGGTSRHAATSETGLAGMRGRRSALDRAGHGPGRREPRVRRADLRGRPAARQLALEPRPFRAGGSRGPGRRTVAAAPSAASRCGKRGQQGTRWNSRLGANPTPGRHRTAGSVSARVTALTVGSVSRRGE